MKKEDITNWKLKEVVEKLEIIHPISQNYKNELLENLKLPMGTFEKINRSNSEIDWSLMEDHYTFFFDYQGDENMIKKSLMNSELSKYESLIIFYGWNEPTIKIPTSLFIDDWEGFLRSTKYQTLIFSEDYKFVLEVTRDYQMHSNFIIRKNE